MMKKVLILSCSTGQGHNSCAGAIREYFALNEVDCDIVDAFAFISDRFAAFMSWGHSFMYRHVPLLFRKGYQYSEERTDAFREGSAAGWLLNRGTDDLRRYIEEGGYDTVICAHSLAAIMLTFMQNEAALSVRTAFVATDHTCYPGMGVCDLDHYFVADSSQVEVYKQCGVPGERIVVSGIPVRRLFFDHCDKKEARSHLGLREEGRLCPREKQCL